MSQAAALYLTADKFASEATTACSRHYWLGARDAFEAVFRVCHSIPNDEAVATYAQSTLGDDADTLLGRAETVLRDRRRATVGESLGVVV